MWGGRKLRRPTAEEGILNGRKDSRIPGVTPRVALPGKDHEDNAFRSTLLRRAGEMALVQLCPWLIENVWETSGHHTKNLSIPMKYRFNAGSMSAQ